MVANRMFVPVLDISYLSKNFQNSETWKTDLSFQNDKTISALVQELRSGFETWGFLYINGHNISESLVREAFDQAKGFFVRPSQYKAMFTRSKGISDGYVAANNEVFDPSKPNDKKEAFDFRPGTDMSTRLSKEMPDTVNVLTNLFEQCKELVMKFLRLLAVALEIDTEYFVKLHSEVGALEMNGTSLRTLFYPSIQPDREKTTEEDRRCREHTDYGTITLLFQDQVGGLEVQSPNGEFVQAKPIPGTIVINAGDLLHAWSNGKYRATLHRVTIPRDENKLLIARQSIAFFCHPNYDVTIESGGNKQNAYEHLNKRFNETIVVN